MAKATPTNPSLWSKAKAAARRSLKSTLQRMLMLGLLSGTKVKAEAGKVVTTKSLRRVRSNG